MKLWEFLLWAGPSIALGVLSNLLTPFARRALKKYWAKTRTLFIQLVSKISTSFSKISTSFKEVSFLAEVKRRAMAFARVVVLGVARLAQVCFFVALLYYGLGDLGNTRRAKAAAPQSSTCYCPSPTGGVHSGTVGHQWGAGVPRGKCTQRYGNRTQYAEDLHVVFSSGGSAYGIDEPLN